MTPRSCPSRAAAAEPHRLSAGDVMAWKAIKVSLSAHQAPSTKRLGAVDCGVVMQGALQLQAVYARSPEPLPMILLNKPYPHASSSTVLGSPDISSLPCQPPDCSSIAFPLQSHRASWHFLFLVRPHKSALSRKHGCPGLSSDVPAIRRATSI